LTFDSYFNHRVQSAQLLGGPSSTTFGEVFLVRVVRAVASGHYSRTFGSIANTGGPPGRTQLWCCTLRRLLDAGACFAQLTWLLQLPADV
jgi:hypothetical protein